MRISDWISDVCSSDLEAQLRAILTELVEPGAPPAITGIANGFHVPGTLPGEGETQLFLNTVTGDPVSLTVLTAADGSRRWAAAFGEIVDGSAAVPARDTLARSEEHTSELQSLMRISYAVFCLKKKTNNRNKTRQ